MIASLHFKFPLDLRYSGSLFGSGGACLFLGLFFSGFSGFLAKSQFLPKKQKFNNFQLFLSYSQPLIGELLKVQAGLWASNWAKTVEFRNVVSCLQELMKKSSEKCLTWLLSSLGLSFIWSRFVFPLDHLFVFLNFSQKFGFRLRAFVSKLEFLNSKDSLRSEISITKKISHFDGAKRFRFRNSRKHIRFFNLFVGTIYLARARFFRLFNLLDSAGFLIPLIFSPILSPSICVKGQFSELRLLFGVKQFKISHVFTHSSFKLSTDAT